MIYLLSDNNYFALGVKALLLSKGYAVKQIDEEAITDADVDSSNTLILSVSDLSVMRKILRCARNLKVIVFLDVRRDFRHFHLGNWTICSRRDAGMISGILKCYHYSDAHQYLTFSQKGILLQLSTGKTIGQVAKEMSISEKTVSAHKIHGLLKLGINRSNRMLLAVLYMIIVESRCIA